MQNRVIVFINDIEAAQTACEVIKKYPVIAFDMEGLNLGRNANVSLVQIAISPYLVYIFDVMVLGLSLFETNTLLPILNDPTILKLCFDCRTDCATLMHRFRIHPYGFYDLQIVYTYVFQSKGDPFLKGYHKAMQALNINMENDLQLKRSFKQIWNSRLSCQKMLFQRPLCQSFLNYCAVDVVYLFKMFESWNISRKFIIRLTYQRILQFVMHSEKSSADPKLMSHIDFGKYWSKK